MPINSIQKTTLLSHWFNKIKCWWRRSYLGSSCLKTYPATRVHSRGIRLITFWYCCWCKMLASGRAGRGRNSKKRMVKRIQRAIWKGFPISFPLWTSRSWGRKWWGYRSTIGYSKRRKVRGDWSYVSKERKEVIGGVSIIPTGAWKWGGCWTGMVGRYRTWEIWGLWTGLNRRTCTDICWNASNLWWGWLAAL